MGPEYLQRPDHDRWRADVAQPLLRRFPEQGDGGDVVSHLWRHRVGYECTEFGRYFVRYDGRGDVTGDDRALGVSTEHDLGVGAVRRRGLDMSARVPDPVDDGSGEFEAIAEIAGSGVVNRIHVDRFSAGLRTQRIDKWLPLSADSRRLGGTSGKHHLDVWAGLGTPRTARVRSVVSPHLAAQRTSEASDSTSDHE